VKRAVTFLDAEEIAALLTAPDRTTWAGRRDHALLLLAIRTGLRASELVNLRCSDAVLGSCAHIRCMGKGRKERCILIDTNYRSLATTQASVPSLLIFGIVRIIVVWLRLTETS
jgi:site-specific recombinase XerD